MNEKRNRFDGRNRSIDVIKGLCILMVIFTHSGWNEEERLKLLFPFWIAMAVPVFMIISGFLYAKSYVKHNICSIGKAYSPKNFFDKIIRYSFPFLIAFLVEKALIILMEGSFEAEGVWQTVYSFFSGNFSGPGSYYYPVMLQFVFYFPILYFLVKKFDFKGFLICGIINLLYEVLQRVGGMTEDCYRLLVFRYTLVIAFGCYLAIGRKKVSKKFLFAGMFVGIAYILLFCYAGFTPWITIYWTGTSFLACLYILPLASRIPMANMQGRILEVLGKASYHIFVVQMVYYHYAGFLYARILYRGLRILVNLFICSVVGLLFYYMERPIINLIKKKFSEY